MSSNPWASTCQSSSSLFGANSFMQSTKNAFGVDFSWMNSDTNQTQIQTQSQQTDSNPPSSNSWASTAPSNPFSVSNTSNPFAPSTTFGTNELMNINSNSKSILGQSTSSTTANPFASQSSSLSFSSPFGSTQNTETNVLTSSLGFSAFGKSAVDSSFNNSNDSQNTTSTPFASNLFSNPFVSADQTNANNTLTSPKKTGYLGKKDPSTVQCRFDGKCTKSDCPFYHLQQPNTSAFNPQASAQTAPFAPQVTKDGRTVCRFWLEGRCNKGDSCMFAHDNPTDGEEMKAESVSENNNSLFPPTNQFSSFGNSRGNAGEAEIELNQQDSNLSTSNDQMLSFESSAPITSPSLQPTKAQELARKKAALQEKIRAKQLEKEKRAKLSSENFEGFKTKGGIIVKPAASPRSKEQKLSDQKEKEVISIWDFPLPPHLQPEKTKELQPQTPRKEEKFTTQPKVEAGTW